MRKYSKPLKLTLLLFSLMSVMSSCFTGSLGFEEGGRTTGSRIYPSATFTHGADYKVICPDKEEIVRRRNMDPREVENLAPPIKLVEPENYGGDCKYEGMSSVFFLFNFIPVTPSLDPGYAIATAVQKVEGDTMINIHAWNEIHYYGIPGRVALFKVRGDIIRFDSKNQETK